MTVKEHKSHWKTNLTRTSLKLEIYELKIELNIKILPTDKNFGVLTLELADELSYCKATQKLSQ